MNIRFYISNYCNYKLHGNQNYSSNHLKLLKSCHDLDAKITTKWQVNKLLCSSNYKYASDNEIRRKTDAQYYKDKINRRQNWELIASDIQI